MHQIIYFYSQSGEKDITLQASPALHEARKSQPGHRVRGARAHTQARLAGEEMSTFAFLCASSPKFAADIRGLPQATLLLRPEVLPVA